MTIEKELHTRSGSQCELCNATEELSVFAVPPESEENADKSVLLCAACRTQLESMDDVHHWRCLNDTMWSQVPAVQVMVWRILTNIRAEGWPQDMLDMLYLEEDVLAWAQAGQENDGGAESEVKHLDSNGVQLASEDSVTLIKDLNVKGGGFTAKRGTIVRNISLVADNPEHIEGRVQGQRIVILTKYVKKAG